MSKYCPKCGTENKDDAQFCHKCGENIENIAVANTSPSTTLNQISKSLSNSAFGSLESKVRSIGTLLVIYGIITLILSIIPICTISSVGTVAEWQGNLEGSPTMVLFWILVFFGLTMGIAAAIMALISSSLLKKMQNARIFLYVTYALSGLAILGNVLPPIAFPTGAIFPAIISSAIHTIFLILVIVLTVADEELKNWIYKGMRQQTTQ